MRECFLCNQLKHNDQFCISTNKKDKLDNTCKHCRKQQQLKRAANAETSKTCPKCLESDHTKFHYFKSGPKQGKPRIYCKSCELLIRKEKRELKKLEKERYLILENTVGPKQCSSCKEKKPLNDFHFHKGSYRTGLPFPNCKSCHNARIREVNESNKERTSFIINKSKCKTQKFKRALIVFMKRGPCHDCGNFYDPYSMEFDHRDMTQKAFTIGKLGKYYSVEILMEEIKKCDLVCSNCHKLRTAKNLGYNYFEDYITQHFDEFVDIQKQFTDGTRRYQSSTT